jgi:phosphoglycerol transferase MdoB-like AlkP superfamily enzyme
MKKIFDSVKNFWLFGNTGKGLTAGKRTVYEIWNVLVLLVSGVFLGVLSLLLAFGNYNRMIFVGYFENELIALMNIIPVVVLLLALYGVFGKGWLSFGITSLIILGFSSANYFLLRFRDDPIMFSDVLLIKEAANMGTNYDMIPGRRMIFCWVAALLITVILYFVQRKQNKFVLRIWISVLMVVLCFCPLKSVYTNPTIYNSETQNFDNINRWSATQLYISKGFVYPFLYSVTEAFPTRPEGYSDEKAKEIITEFSDTDIPEDKKVNVIAVMLEAFCDLSDIGIVDGVSHEVYKNYHAIRDESCHGTLVTNIFAGGTIDSERAFLTGYTTHPNYRKDVNSYVRYFKNQGYNVEGSHPSYAWFYNRRNVNSYLGFDNYRFFEDYYSKITPGAISVDSVVFPEILKMYNDGKQKEVPYFSFHVTYQGHGPYALDTLVWTKEKVYENTALSEQSEYILNNYFGSVMNTAENMKIMLDALRDDDKPCVVLFFGDHKPWLGDGNSVYNELGINLDTSSEEGYLNYYATEYIIWANNKAKEVLDSDFVGEDERISTNYLMNKLFELCSWEGNAYMQYTDKVKDTLPVINSAGFYNSKGEFVGTYTGILDAHELETLLNYRIAQSYMSGFCADK